VATALTLLLVASAAYGLAEHASVADSVWWAVITATTVGYGDAYPATTAGKVVAMCLIIAMVLIFIPMVTASFASKLIVNRDAFTHEEQEEIKAALTELLNRTHRNDDCLVPAEASDVPPRPALPARPSS
jgi:voltage-gated potassium channel